MPGSRFQQPTGVDGPPDMVTLAKGLGGGLPIGACIALGPRRRPARTGSARHDVRRQPGRARPSRQVLDMIEADDLLDHVQVDG